MEQTSGDEESGSEPILGERLDRFLIEINERRSVVMGLFAIAVIFLIVQLPYLITVEPNSPLFVVSVLNVFGLVVFVSFTGTALWYCRQLRRRRAERWQS